MICAFFLAPSKICSSEILRPPSLVFLSDFGAEDEALYSSSEDDKPKRAENTSSAAGSFGFCYPTRYDRFHMSWRRGEAIRGAAASGSPNRCGDQINRRKPK